MTELSIGTKIAFGSGDTGFSLTTTIIAAYLAMFLIDVVGLPPEIAAAAVSGGKSWDYVNDPLIGHLSDRTRTRWGRRRPYLLFGPLPFAAAFVLLWWRPPLSGHVALAVYYAYFVFETAATFVYMPYFALTPELTSDYDERTSLTSYRMFFSILASLLAFTLPLVIIGSFRPENAPRVLLMGALFAVLSAAPLWLVFLHTREKEAHLEMAPPKLLDSLKAAFRNPPFLFSPGIYLFTWLAVDIMQSVLLFFIKYALGRFGYVANAEVQTRSAVLLLRMLTGPIPSVFLLAAILCAIFYPLSRRRFVEICAELESRKEGAP